MSKEIAQTLGGKRIAWLIAIVAAFAVFAVMSTQWQGAKADVAALDFYLDECSTPIGVADIVDDATVTPVAPGTAGCYEISIDTLAAPTAGDMQIVVNFDNDFTVTAVTPIASNGGVPVCAVAAGSIVTCTYPGPEPAGIVANIQITGTINGDLALPTFTAQDLGSAQGPVAGTNQVLAVAVVDTTTGTLTKINAPATVPQAGGPYTSTIVFTNDVGAEVTSATVTIADAIPAGATVTAVSVASANVLGVALAAADCGAVLPLAGPAALSCVVNFTAGSFDAGDSVTLTVTSTVGPNPGLDPRTLTDTATLTASVDGLAITDTQAAAVVQGGAVFSEIRHMSDIPNVVIPRQEINNNVRGSRHTICVVALNTGIDLNGDGDALDLNVGGDAAADEPALPVILPGIDLSNIVVTNGGGYLSTIDTDPTFTDVRIFIGDGTATGRPTSTVTAGLDDATCISWVSTDAGDQQINIVYVDPISGDNINVSWDSDNDNNDGDGVLNDGVANRSLIKEWNRLEDSLVTLTGGATGSASGNSATVPVLTRTVNVVLNPATGLWQFSSIGISDVFRGNHTNSAGVLEGLVAGVATPLPLVGVNVTATLGGCGALNSDDVPVTTIVGVTALDAAGNVILVDAAGNPLTFSFAPGASTANCGPGRTATITFTGSEPGPLGSGTGITVTEIVVINFAQNIAEKKVFLAWAGQRIILEHDWRINPGDNAPFTSAGPTPNGTCPFFGPSFDVQAIKGTGPGNFLPGLNVFVNGADEAIAEDVGTSDNSQTLQTAGLADNDIIGDPQDNCISRFLYESEDPGEVDIEMFALDENDNINSTKVAFVVYYMKINTINISLASQFEKPSHNNGTSLPDWTSGAAGARTAPVNPWDASKDDADNAVDWNVSKDILVRGRVTGWFTNSNPSGRAADATNPLNVLPANRWVMPQDWVLLAGGPADPADGTDAIGTAEQFRPYYDLMFAPNNARGLNLANPEGTVATQLTFIGASSGIGTVASPVRVVSCADIALLPANSIITIGATPVFLVSCSGTSLVVSTVFVTAIVPAVPLAAAPAAGTGVFLPTGVPFEGPYSTIDIVGLAAQGFGGAALSNFVIGNIRDTALDDGDVDWFDAPMPSTHVSVNIRGTGFIKEVLKDEVYYLGTPNNAALQIYTNPYYISNIPGSPFIPAVVAGGGYLWDSWGLDGPGGNGQGVYRFWQPVLIGVNSEGIGEGLSAADQLELGLIRTYTGDPSIARDLVVYTDNHGEFMVAANGDFKTDLTACATNVLAGGKHCKPGDKVGVGTIRATVDYPDFRGKHFPVASNSAAVTWLWGGYKDVTVEDGETDQFKYIVFHAMDRDGFCSAGASGATLLHSVLGTASAGSDDLDTAFTIANLGGSAAITAGGRYNNDPVESIDFLIDSGEGIIVGGSGGSINDGKQFATGIPTFSLLENDPGTTGLLEFPLSSLAAAGQVDECQAYIKVSNSLLGVLNVLAIAKDDEGNIGFDRIIDLTNTTSYTLNFRWSLITWAGADNISVNDAIKGTGTSGKNPGGNDISASVTAIYGWDAAAQQWLGFFPSGVNVPGANDLTVLKTGQAYWIAITGPSSVTWTIASNVN